ncbi:MAG: serine/threonine-protein kinase, partial [Planctomycetota bacterium]
MTDKNDDTTLARKATLDVAKAAEPPMTATWQPSISGYSLICVLHTGGQGTVYLAIQESTGQQVAIKVLRHGGVSTPIERARLEREVQVLGQLKHPGIVTIHDSGFVDGMPYIVMDYIDGQPLSDFSHELRQDNDSLLDLLIRITDAIQAAHIRGVIHRDIKPVNILVDDEGRPIVVDFGLAKQEDASSAAPSLTQTGQFVGSLPWAAPEQVRGDDSQIDTRTDVFALGAVFYQALTGRLPHDCSGSHAEILHEITTVEPQPMRRLDATISDELDTIIAKCLAKESDRRYQTAGELASDLRRLSAGEPILARPPSISYLIRKQFQRHRARAVAITIALSAIVVGGLAAAGGMLWALNERTHAMRETAAANVARESAVEEQRRAQRVVEFMNTILQGANPA